MASFLKMALVLSLATAALGLDLKSILGIGSTDQRNLPKPEVVEIIKWLQPVCIVPVHGVPRCPLGSKHGESDEDDHSDEISLERENKDKNLPSSETLEGSESKKSSAESSPVVAPKLITPEVVETVRVDDLEPSSLDAAGQEKGEKTLTVRTKTPELDSVSDGADRKGKYLEVAPEGKTVRRPAVHVTKVVESHVTATLIPNNCFPHIGIPPCPHHPHPHPHPHPEPHYPHPEPHYPHPDPHYPHPDPHPDPHPGYEPVIIENPEEPTIIIAESPEHIEEHEHSDSSSEEEKPENFWEDPSNPHYDDGKPVEKPGLLQGIHNIINKPTIVHTNDDPKVKPVIVVKPTKPGIFNGLFDRPGFGLFGKSARAEEKSAEVVIEDEYSSEESDEKQGFFASIFRPISRPLLVKNPGGKPILIERPIYVIPTRLRPGILDVFRKPDTKPHLHKDHEVIKEPVYVYQKPPKHPLFSGNLFGNLFGNKPTENHKPFVVVEEHHKPHKKPYKPHKPHKPYKPHKPHKPHPVIVAEEHHKPPVIIEKPSKPVVIVEDHKPYETKPIVEVEEHHKPPVIIEKPSKPIIVVEEDKPHKNPHHPYGPKPVVVVEEHPEPHEPHKPHPVIVVEENPEPTLIVDKPHKPAYTVDHQPTPVVIQATFTVTGGTPSHATAAADASAHVGPHGGATASSVAEASGAGGSSAIATADAHADSGHGGASADASAVAQASGPGGSSSVAVADAHSTSEHGGASANAVADAEGTSGHGSDSADASAVASGHGSASADASAIASGAGGSSATASADAVAIESRRHIDGGHHGVVTEHGEYHEVTIENDGYHGVMVGYSGHGDDSSEALSGSLAMTGHGGAQASSVAEASGAGASAIAESEAVSGLGGSSSITAADAHVPSNGGSIVELVEVHSPTDVYPKPIKGYRGHPRTREYLQEEATNVENVDLEKEIKPVEEVKKEA